MTSVLRSPDMEGDPVVLAVAPARHGATEAVAAVPVPPPIMTAQVVAAAVAAPMDDTDDTTLDAAAAAVLDPSALLEQIEAQREKVLADGYEAGYASGREAAQQEVREALEAETAVVGDLLEAMREAFTQHLQEQEDVLVEIAFESVCKVLGRTLVTREGVSAVVREVLEQVRERDQLVIRLAPDDLALLDEVHPDLPGQAEAWRAQLVADERVARGGCLIDSPGGTLDGRLETQIHRLRDVLLAARARDPEGD